MPRGTRCRLQGCQPGSGETPPAAGVQPASITLCPLLDVPRRSAFLPSRGFDATALLTRPRGTRKCRRPGHRLGRGACAIPSKNTLAGPVISRPW